MAPDASPPLADGDLLAAVDLGSNSFHMVVTRYVLGQLRIVDRIKEHVRLAEGLDVAEEVVASAPVRAVTDARFEPRPQTPAERDQWVRASAWSYHHPVGTCALGIVVDEECRLDGLEGLRVVDASVLPEVPSANTNLPTLAVAEHFARRYRQAPVGPMLAAAR